MCTFSSLMSSIAAKHMMTESTADWTVLQSARPETGLHRGWYPNPHPEPESRGFAGAGVHAGARPQRRRAWQHLPAALHGRPPVRGRLLQGPQQGVGCAPASWAVLLASSPSLQFPFALIMHGWLLAPRQGVGCAIMGRQTKSCIKDLAVHSVCSMPSFATEQSSLNTLTRAVLRWMHYHVRRVLAQARLQMHLRARHLASVLQLQAAALPAVTRARERVRRAEACVFGHAAQGCPLSSVGVRIVSCRLGVLITLMARGAVHAFPSNNECARQLSGAFVADP